VLPVNPADDSVLQNAGRDCYGWIYLRLFGMTTKRQLAILPFGRSSEDPVRREVRITRQLALDEVTQRFRRIASIR
jgi:hypothetical protein